MDRQDETLFACSLVNAKLYGIMSETGDTPNYDSTIRVTVDPNTNTVTLDMTGPASWYFGFGFGNDVMADTYAIIVTENGDVFEYILGNHFAGTDVTNGITIESNTEIEDTSGGSDGLTYRNVIISRTIEGDSDNDDFVFPTENGTQFEMIWAQGNGNSWTAPSNYHGFFYKGVSSITLQEVNTSM